MSNSPIDYLKSIIDECSFVASAIDNGLTRETFLRDEVVKRAFVRSLEIIGEASKKIPVDWKLKWNKVEWKQIAGMRDRLIHDYMGVNYNIVWDVVINKLPQLNKNIELIIKEEENKK